MHQGPVFAVNLASQPRENIPFTAHLVQLDPEPGFPLAHEIWVDFRGTVLELKTPQDVALLRARLAVFDAGLAALGQELAGVAVDGAL